MKQIEPLKKYVKPLELIINLNMQVFNYPTVAGKPFVELPLDLFIPEDALEVLLDSFSGPLDLLLYLIRRQDIDILDIPIVLITEQYMQYIQGIERKRFELAADYLVMAALLAEIKSRFLLPRPAFMTEEDIEEDPRVTLIKKLQVYEQFKNVAEKIDMLPRCERELFRIKLPCAVVYQGEFHPPDVDLLTLTQVMKNFLQRQSQLTHHTIVRESISVHERTMSILQRLSQEKTLPFKAFLKENEGRKGLVACFLAILELGRQFLILITQEQLFSPIYLQMNRHEE